MKKLIFLITVFLLHLPVYSLDVVYPSKSYTEVNVPYYRIRTALPHPRPRRHTISSSYPLTPRGCASRPGKRTTPAQCTSARCTETISDGCRNRPCPARCPYCPERQIPPARSPHRQSPCRTYCNYKCRNKKSASP